MEESLKSIRRQEIDQAQIEILLVDGGSTDKTAEIARKYHAEMIHNERKLPEFAKQQGLLAAKGTYGIFIDSDESFLNMCSLKNRIEMMEKHPSVKKYCVDRSGVPKGRKQGRTVCKFYWRSVFKFCIPV